uniref:Reverse transcriptase domain-containing protein n=1 Tax=Cacopsylla melanoneura TaxID=428564 RepID=A0A8D8SX65_9HEMI
MSQVKNKFNRLNNNISVSYKKAKPNIDKELALWSDEARKLQKLHGEMLVLHDELDEEDANTELLSADHLQLMDDVETLILRYSKEEKKHRKKKLSLIHDNRALQDIQKFHYLDSCLELEAREEISHLQLTEQNYNIAWDHLNQIYNNNRSFVQTNIKQIFDVQYDTRNSVSSLKKILSVCKTNLVALKTLDPSISIEEQIIIYIIESKMDRYLFQEWSKKGNKKELNTLDKLFEFLDEMVCIFTSTGRYGTGRSLVNESDEIFFKNWNNKLPQSIPLNLCAICGTGHKTENCTSFKKALVKERIEIIKKHKLCFNCLSNKHGVSRCPERQRCGTCNRKHHISIHMDQKSMQAYKVVEDVDGSVLDYEIPTPSVEESMMKANSYTNSVSNSDTSIVLLPTALVYVKSGDGQATVPVRALLDAGSQVHLISTSCMEKLKLKATNVDIKLCGIGKASVDATKVVDIQVQTKSGEFSRKLRAIALPQITSNMPAQKINIDKHKYLLQYELADPEFFIPNSVDMILGAEIFYDILKPGRVANFPGRPAMQNTIFGWVVAGRLPIYSDTKSTHSCMHVTFPDPLSKFWEIEELPALKNNYSKEETECEEYFEETTYRSEDGKYVVRIPFKENLKDIGHSKRQALQRYNSLEKRLDKDEKLKTSYNSFLKEYLDLGHMERVRNSTLEETSGNTEFYFSHFPVVRSESLTTKLRVVFDGSMKTSSGISLNETMKVGPILQDDLFSILLRLRVHKIVLISDLEKMYRQIWIHSDDRKYQKILWRKEEHEDIETFQLKTVTYGTSSAPYLAVKCLKTLANDEEKAFPNASKIAKRDFYVDDLITGVESEEEGIALYKELTVMFGKAGFNLRKWISNSESVLNAIPGENRADQLDSVFQNTMKTLGLKYNPKTDTFLFSLQPGNIQFTKRNILSEIGKLFDPLGLISPVIVTAKMFLQELWLLNFSWDEKLDEKTVLRWRQIVSGMEHINQIQIDRHAFVSSSSDIEFHGFCDASEKAYAACLYVKCKHNGETTVKLLCAKTRVAPVKQISLARLELCAALLLTNLIKKVRESLDEHSIGRQWFAWTDSQIVLAWISKLPCKWKTFVANRVSAIQEVLSPDQWKYVKSEDNPADLASRGCSSLELSNAKEWWNGPTWLVSDSYKQDNTQVVELNNVPEAKKIKVTSLVVAPELDIFGRYSHYSK